MAGGKLRVQEYIKRSGRGKLLARAYDDIPTAYTALAVAARKCYNSFAEYDKETDDVVNHAIITTNNRDTITVTRGTAVREFTIVTKADRTPIPFDHLVRNNSFVRRV